MKRAFLQWSMLQPTYPIAKKKSSASVSFLRNCFKVRLIGGYDLTKQANEAQNIRLLRRSVGAHFRESLESSPFR